MFTDGCLPVERRSSRPYRECKSDRRKTMLDVRRVGRLPVSRESKCLLWVGPSFSEKCPGRKWNRFLQLSRKRKGLCETQDRRSGGPRGRSKRILNVGTK